ncbi:MAG: ATP-binding cassette domain-containing protein [Kiritimatiellia bacterium]
MLFEVSNLTAGYGGAAVINDTSLSADRGDLVMIRGANGSGKSTFLKALSGQLSSVSGAIFFKGNRVGCNPFSGGYLYADLYAVPQWNGVFDELTVEENLLISARSHGNSRKGIPELLLPFIEKQSHVRAGLLSGGERKVLSLSMAFASLADLLLIDEPLAGLSEGNGLGEMVVRTLLAAPRSGKTVLFVEHREARLVKEIEDAGDIKVFDLKDGKIRKADKALEVSK